MATYSWNFTTRATFTVLLVVTPTHKADWWIAVPHLLWLVTCSLSANLLSSSRLMSSSLRWGPFSCCLTISRSFLCCWERKVTIKWVLSGAYLYKGTIADCMSMELFFLLDFFVIQRKKRDRKSCNKVSLFLTTLNKYHIWRKTSRSFDPTITFAYFKSITGLFQILGCTLNKKMHESVQYFIN